MVVGSLVNPKFMLMKSSLDVRGEGLIVSMFENISLLYLCHLP